MAYDIKSTFEVSLTQDQIKEAIKANVESSTGRKVREVQLFVTDSDRGDMHSPYTPGSVSAKVLFDSTSFKVS